MNLTRSDSHYIGFFGEYVTIYDEIMTNYRTKEFRYNAPRATRAYVRQRPLGKPDACIICLADTGTRTWCCNKHVHQECLQEWINMKPKNLCPLRCGGRTCPDLKRVLRRKY